MTALQKPNGGVRGVVVGDIIRRLVARTMAKQVSKQAEVATAPFQYALSTKAGCECVAHILQCATDVDPEATVISVDGVGAYDLISRSAMLEGLLRMEGGDQIFQHVFWKTRAPPRSSSKVKEGSKAILSCPCFLGQHPSTPSSTSEASG